MDWEDDICEARTRESSCRSVTEDILSADTTAPSTRSNEAWIECDSIRERIGDVRRAEEWARSEVGNTDGIEKCISISETICIS